MKAEKPSVFVREATGLVRNVSFVEAVSLTLIWMSVVPALGNLGYSTVLLPTTVGANLVVASAISALLVIPQNIVYTILTRRIPRTGGDYVWLSRQIPPLVATALSFAGMTAETIPYIALIALSTISAATSAAALLGMAGASVVNVPTYAEAVLACFIIALFVGVNTLSPKAGYRIVTALWIVGLAGIVTGIATLLFAGRAGIVNYMNSLAPGIDYEGVARTYQGPVFSWQSTLSLLPFFALFTYPWFQAAPAVGSELRGRALKWTVPTGLATAFILVTAPLAAMYYVGGYGFINSALHDSTLVFQYSFGFWTLAMGVSQNTIMRWILAAAWVSGSLGVVAFGVILVSRYILAQSFDRFLPASLSHVSSRLGTPVNANLVILAVGSVLAVLSSYMYGTFVSLYGVLVGAMVYFVAIGVAAARLGSKLAGTEGKWLVAAGTAQAAVFVYLAYAFVVNAQVWGGNPLAYGYEIVAFLMGVLFYVYSKKRNAARGVDITLAFREIPPE